MSQIKPLAVGARVRHYGQQYFSAVLEGTGNIIEVQGPYRDGTYEYLVQQDAGFSGGGPAGKPSWWSSDATIPIAERAT